MTSTTAPQTPSTTPLARGAHTDQPWRIHEIAPDFRLEDVWALPTAGGPDDLPRLLETLAGRGGEFPWLYRTLFAIRWKLGRLLGLDDEDAGIGPRVASLRDRLPDDLRDGPTGPTPANVPLTPVFLTDREWVAEIANTTCHALMHLSWVPDGHGGWRGQLAVLNKPNGRAGHAYMAFIKPFRCMVIYPALLRTIGKRWQSGVAR